MSSLTWSILILAILVALGVAAHSLWVLQREKKKLARLKPGDRGVDLVPSAAASGASLPEPSAHFSAEQNRAERFEPLSELPSELPSELVPEASAAATHGSSATRAGEPSFSQLGVAGEPKFSADELQDSPPVLEEALPGKAANTGFSSSDTSKTSRAAQPAQGSLLDEDQPVATATNGLVHQAKDSAENAPAPAAATPSGRHADTLDEAIPAGTRILHDEADCLVEIALPQQSSGDRLIGLTKTIRRAGGKPVAFEGLTSEGTWEGLRYGTSYRRLRAGILLSNRQGPLNALEFSEFTSKLQALGAQLGVPIDMPEMNAILQRARSLDGLLADSDVQLGLAVDCARALSSNDLATLAKQLGLHERGNSRYALLSEQAEIIYSVTLGDKTQRLQLMFDVPRVRPEHKPWWKMAEAANQAAVLFDGRITDDGGRELSEQSFRNVAIALEGRQQTLEESGVAAGSALAMRVFN
jgi:hypothetical protein